MVALGHAIFNQPTDFMSPFLCRIPKFCLFGIALATPAWAQTQGTKLPGLSEPAPAVPAAPDFAALRKKAGTGDAAAQVQLADAILSGLIQGAKRKRHVGHLLTGCG